MNKITHMLACSVGDRRYALPLGAVEQLVRIVEVTPVSGAPDSVLGLIDVRGRIMPVIDMRKRFGLPDRSISLKDLLVVVRASNRTVALKVDGTSGVVEFPEEEVIKAHEILPGMGTLLGVVKIDDEMVLIQDMNSFFSRGERAVLDEVVTADADGS